MTINMVVHEDGTWFPLEGTVIVELTEGDVEAMQEMTDSERYEEAVRIKRSVRWVEVD